MNKAWVVERKVGNDWSPLFERLLKTRNAARLLVKGYRGLGYRNEFRIRRWVREGEK